MTARGAAALAAAALAACPAGARAAAPPPEGATVFAAASLTEVLTTGAPRNAYNFAGSDQLAFQIRQGAPADVFASASPRYTRDLRAAGLLGPPRVFATNALTVIVPARNPAGIRRVRDLARPGVKLVIGDANVPVGAYTRSAFTRLGLAAALRNVVSEEADVKAITGKVALGEADAGVVYVTDVRPVRRAVRTVAIPRAAQPAIRYEVAALTRPRDAGRARAYVRWLLGPAGRSRLTSYGFGVP